MGSPDEDVELLVHITAPATTTSDEDYRQLARAYLSFDPSHTTALMDPEDSEIASSVEVVDDSFAEDPSKPRGSVEAFSANKAPRHGENSSSSRVFTPGPNSASAAGGQVVRDTESGGSVIAGSQVEEPEDESLIEEVSDSCLTGSVTLDPFISPTRMLEHHLRRLRSSAQPPKRALEYERDEDQLDELAGPPQKTAKTGSQRTPQKSSSLLQEPVLDGMEKITVDATISVDSVLVCDSPNAAGDPVETTTVSAGPAMSRESEGPARAPPNSMQSPLFPDAPLRRHQSDHGTKTSIAPVAPLLIRSISAPSTAVSPEVLESYKKKFTALEVFPPEPPVSDSHLTESSFLAPRLKKLAEEAPLEQVYRPRFHSSKAGKFGDKSDLRPLQRGYWLLDMSTWDEPARWATWARLHECISEGVAGWRVWCLRDEACVRIRTYCFASLAGHVYLFLNEASGGRARYVDVEWIGDGRPRISVPAAMGHGARE